ncbi:hypothetical protein FVE85_6505 [Porphyridium purpureum]|uniref:Uncharacterized protein n=1 Tax=Porphyridium purpureum TaxID=35688 RepID=A0A5J4Z6Y8_PORPP|nr:hypothetical protein FVE85_6505 [Porphyridium purpureum]|eukprot:POR1843..scf295_1
MEPAREPPSVTYTGPQSILSGALSDGSNGDGTRRRPGRPATYNFDGKAEDEMSAQELKLKQSIEKRRRRQNEYHQRKREKLRAQRESEIREGIVSAGEGVAQSFANDVEQHNNSLRPQGQVTKAVKLQSTPEDPPNGTHANAQDYEQLPSKDPRGVTSGSDGTNALYRHLAESLVHADSNGAPLAPTPHAHAQVTEPPQRTTSLALGSHVNTGRTEVDSSLFPTSGHFAAPDVLLAAGAPPHYAKQPLNGPALQIREPAPSQLRKESGADLSRPSVFAAAARPWQQAPHQQQQAQEQNPLNRQMQSVGEFQADVRSKQRAQIPSLEQLNKASLPTEAGIRSQERGRSPKRSFGNPRDRSLTRFLSPFDFAGVGEDVLGLGLGNSAMTGVQTHSGLGSRMPRGGAPATLLRDSSVGPEKFEFQTGGRSRTRERERFVSPFRFPSVVGPERELDFMMMPASSSSALATDNAPSGNRNDGTSLPSLPRTGLSMPHSIYGDRFPSMSPHPGHAVGGGESQENQRRVRLSEGHAEGGMVPSELMNPSGPAKAYNAGLTAKAVGVPAPDGARPHSSDQAAGHVYQTGSQMGAGSTIRVGESEGGSAVHVESGNDMKPVRTRRRDYAEVLAELHAAPDEERDSLLKTKVFPSFFDASALMYALDIRQSGNLGATQLLHSWIGKGFVSFDTELCLYQLSDAALRALGDDVAFLTSPRGCQVLVYGRTMLVQYYTLRFMCTSDLQLSRSGIHRLEMMQFYEANRENIECAILYAREIDVQLWRNLLEVCCPVMRLCTHGAQRISTFSEVVESYAASDKLALHAEMAAEVSQRARLELALAEAYMDELSFDEALVALESVRRLLSGRESGTSTSTLSELSCHAMTHMLLSKVMLSRQRLVEASGLINGVLRMLEDTGILGSLLGVHALVTLSFIQLAQGNAAEAQKVARNFPDATRNLNFDFMPEFADIVGVGGLVSLFMGHYAEAETKFEEALRLLVAYSTRKVNGTSLLHIHYLGELEFWLREGIVRCLQKQNRLKESEDMRRQALTLVSERNMVTTLQRSHILKFNANGMPCVEVGAWVTSIRHVY